MTDKKNWSTSILVASTLIGATLGLAAGLLYIRVSEEAGGPKKVSTGQAVKFGMAALGLVRQAAQLAG